MSKTDGHSWSYRSITLRLWGSLSLEVLEKCKEDKGFKVGKEQADDIGFCQDAWPNSGDNKFKYFLQPVNRWCYKSVANLLQQGASFTYCKSFEQQDKWA